MMVVLLHTETGRPLITRSAHVGEPQVMVFPDEVVAREWLVRRGASTLYEVCSCWLMPANVARMVTG